ncbi:MAG: SocA family protein [Micromonosporaceae bacterium]|nr:SocA family protein [Micromonosporaceae bacterium]
MTVPARDVAAAIRQRLPNLGTVKLHKLLYYCQGHHLAQFGRPLFGETISAWDMGPVVPEVWHAERAPTAGAAPPSAGAPEAGRPEPAALGEAELNTIGYVVHRYGRLTGRELTILSHGEAPWQRANRGRPLRGSAPIDPAWIAEQFIAAETDDRAEDVALDPAEVARVREGAVTRAAQREAVQRARGPARPDSLDAVLAWAHR